MDICCTNHDPDRERSLPLSISRRPKTLNRDKASALHGPAISTATGTKSYVCSNAEYLACFNSSFCACKKVPGLYWSGGDVIYDCGFGCYAPPGCLAPPNAENYHFSHCVPGLLTMHVTKDDEVCGTFSITFKALPQLDLRSVVFGRVVLPSRTFTNIQPLGRATSTQPVIEIVLAQFQ